MNQPPWGKNAGKLFRADGVCHPMPDEHLIPHEQMSGCCGCCKPCGFRAQNCQGCQWVVEDKPCFLCYRPGHGFRCLIPADLVSPDWCPGREEQ